MTSMYCIREIEGMEGQPSSALVGSVPVKALVIATGFKYWKNRITEPCCQFLDSRK
jgi:hypothetical protein